MTTEGSVSWTCRIQSMCETAHKHFACVRVRPNTHKTRITFPWGVISVWSENSWCGKPSHRKREGERKWDGERGIKVGKRSHLAINSFSCPSGTAELRHSCPPESISGWQSKNCIPSSYSFFFLYPLVATLSPLYSPRMQLLLFLAYLYTNVFGLVLYSLAVKNIKYMLPYFSKPKLPVHQSPTDIDTNI